MKAYQIQRFGPKGLVEVEMEKPSPGPHEVLVRIKAAALNYRDVMVVNGTYNPRMKLPAIPLSDAAGEIESIGSEVTRWKQGDRIMPIFAQRWYEGSSTE